MKTKLAIPLLTAGAVLVAVALPASAQERVISERIILVAADEPKPGEKPAEKPVVIDHCGKPCPPRPCCLKPCREPMVCVPEPSKTTKRTTVYSSKESPYCLKKCPNPLAGLFGGGCCDPCGNPASCGDCEKVRYKNVLLKRVVTEEVPDYKCTPKPAPCTPSCGHGLFKGHGYHGTIIEVVPAPQPKETPK